MTQPSGPSARKIAETWLIECREETEFYILAKAYLALESRCKLFEAALREIIAIGNDPMENSKNGYLMQAEAEKALQALERE